MNIWKQPMAVGQNFAANEYVAACYNIYCATPHENGVISKLYNDTNGNGVYDEGIDLLEAEPGAARGCDEKHVGIISGDPNKVNGFVQMREANDEGIYEIVPVFWWVSDTGYHTSIPGGSSIEDYGNMS